MEGWRSESVKEKIKEWQWCGLDFQSFGPITKGICADFAVFAHRTNLVPIQEVFPREASEELSGNSASRESICITVHLEAWQVAELFICKTKAFRRMGNGLFTAGRLMRGFERNASHKTDSKMNLNDPGKAISLSWGGAIKMQPPGWPHLLNLWPLWIMHKGSAMNPDLPSIIERALWHSGEQLGCGQLMAPTLKGMDNGQTVQWHWTKQRYPTSAFLAELATKDGMTWNRHKSIRKHKVN